VTAFKQSSGTPALFRRKRRRALPIGLALALLAGGGVGAYMFSNREPEPPDIERAKVVRSCDVPVEILERVWRGYVPGRSGDVLTVERLPNQFNTRHSTPFEYTQEVPLLFYGPGFIEPGSHDVPTTVADIAPTVASILKFDDFPDRDGAALPVEKETDRVPKLIVTLVWDGGGDNVLNQWPDAWPNLKRLMTESAYFRNTTVGSSPSITPSIHATIGTGVFPQTHGLSDTRIRVKGEMLDAWDGISPQRLRAKTLADLWDAANDNVPIVGMVARDTWHLGMIGHGSYLPEGDSDIAVMDDFGQVEFRQPGRYYTLPDYLLGNEGLQAAVDEVDQRDGKADQRWLGNPILPIDGRVRETPAWSIYQTEKIKQLFANEGFGSDDVPDLFFTNYKSTDLVGHSYNMVEPEEESVLQEQDRQLKILIDYLDKKVGGDNYVLVLTADHGMTPYPSVTGGWSIVMTEMTDDIEKRFDHVTPNIPLVLSNRGYQIMLNHNEMKRNDITSEDIAAYLRNYTIEDNAPSESAIGDNFKDRIEEKVFLTALTPDELKQAVTCARKTQPPP
jgi:predicted AlkP superfamily pyrophosphatase or phosphodiesterase